MPRPVITLLTDFGTRDYYVAAIKGTLLRLAPDALPIDISHEVEPGNIEEGAFLLGATHRHFPDGTVHLAVIDPGVGGRRRLLAARTETALFVAPDNGVLSSLPSDAEIRQIEARELFLDAPGQTFQGRDRFAPVAAYLARGGSFNGLGRRVHDLLRLDAKPPKRGADFLEGRIVHIDRFGNLVTDIPSIWFPENRALAFDCRLPGLEVRRWATHYAELAAGEAALVPGSLGTLEVSVKQESAADRARVERNHTLRINFR